MPDTKVFVDQNQCGKKMNFIGEICGVLLF